jgi:hypothetical protein
MVVEWILRVPCSTARLQVVNGVVDDNDASCTYQKSQTMLGFSDTSMVTHGQTYNGSTYAARQPIIPIVHNAEYHISPTTASTREVVIDESSSLRISGIRIEVCS